MLQLQPGTQQNTSTLIIEYISQALKWPAWASSNSEWIRTIATYLKQYDSYHIYTNGSCKNELTYEDIYLAVNGPAHPDRITAAVSIIIVPQSDGWKANSNNDWNANKDTPLQCIHITDGSTIGAQSVYSMELLATLAALQLADNI